MSDLNQFFKYKTGWRVKPKLEGDPRYAEYVKRMADAQRALDPERYNKPKPVKPDGMTKDEWIFSMQEKSTQEIITKQKDPDYKRDWSAPMADPTVRREDGSIDINERKVSIDEASHIESIRRRSKNTLGQSELSGTSKEDKSRAGHHFLVSPPANLTAAEMELVTPLKPLAEGVPASLPEKETWKKLTTWQALMHWAKGGRVRRDKE